MAPHPPEPQTLGSPTGPPDARHDSVAHVVEQGDLFFAFRRRVGTAHVHDLRDVQRFYIVLGTHEPHDHFRVLIVGRKHLPEPGVERTWAYNSLTTDDPEMLDDELAGKDYQTKTRGLRHLPEAELAGEGAYRIVIRDDGASELVYALQQPEVMGPLQRELGIHAEGRLIIAVRNPDLGRLGARGGPTAEFPPELRARFGSHRWLSVDDPHLLDFPNAQIILIAARGKPLALGPGDDLDKHQVRRLLRGRVRRALDDEATPRPPLRFICPMCLEGFETRSQYDQHLLGAHPPRAPSAADLASALKGVHFPLSRDQLVAEAEKRPTDPRVIDLIKALPERQFRGVTDVAKALGDLKSRLPG